MNGKTKLRWIYVVDLEKNSWTMQLKILGYSLGEISDQVGKTKYRNWTVQKIERTTWVSDLSDIEGEPKTITRETP